jgi:hypothetical protein
MHDPIPLHERAGQIAEADELFTGADERYRASLHSPGFVHDFLAEAAQMFYAAAVKYLDLGLGLQAREAWARAAECHRELAKEELHYAALAQERRDSVPVLWGEEEAPQPESP